ncbi:AcrR family transcriptional regulator [Pseudonocardia eucalypti]|uniref:TetR/AcrR family transcriptional regulator n=1 Tax=Pseudonocardia eucalypti TaxID=648755 RepID=UPI0017E1E70F|nr:AcrR family transcriptional regulator [Pseudonocardia eucalypti]
MAARRERILDAAWACFGRYGYAGATVRRLEQATGMSRGAIFHHFGDKEMLFLALVDREARRIAVMAGRRDAVGLMREMLADAGAGDGHGGLELWWEISHRLRTEDGFRTAWATHAEAVTGAITRRLEHQRGAGRVRSDVPVRALALYLQLICEGLVSQLADVPASDELHAVLDFVTDSLR